MPEPGPAVEYEARSRLGLAEADAFLARLETLSFDITGPLGRLSGGVADVQASSTSAAAGSNCFRGALPGSPARDDLNG